MVATSAGGASTDRSCQMTDLVMTLGFFAVTHAAGFLVFALAYRVDRDA